MKKKKAVALKYRNNEDAPRIVAKGERSLAELILKIAGENGIPIEKNEWLAQTLMQFDVGDYIPEEVYEVVARLLAFVYKLNLGDRNGYE